MFEIEPNSTLRLELDRIRTLTFELDELELRVPSSNRVQARTSRNRTTEAQNIPVCADDRRKKIFSIGSTLREISSRISIFCGKIFLHLSLHHSQTVSLWCISKLL